jgi:hypothetical protein
MRYHIHILWGIFYRTQSYLQSRFPRRYPGSRTGKFMSGDEQLLTIKKAIEGTFRLKGLQIIPYDDSCSVCNQVANKPYKEEELPPIPLPNCPYGTQCRAIYSPIVDYGLYKVTQILTVQPNLRVQELRKLLRIESEKEGEQTLSQE